MMTQAVQNQKSKRHTQIVNFLTYFVLVLLAILCIVPFYNMIIGSTHDNAALSSGFQMLPGKQLLSNYQKLADNVNIWRGMANSIFISVTYTLISTYFGALTAYGFAKYKFRFNKQLFWVVLATMMVPAQLGIIGYYQLMNTMHLLDTYVALLMPAFATPAMVFWNRQYIDSYVPDALIESARIDGCGEFKIFNRIILPIILPGIATQAIFTFVTSWNSFMQPSILLFSQEKYTLPILVAQMKGLYIPDYGVSYLGVTMSVVPILIVFSLCSRQILEGATAGAVKG